MRTIAPTSDDEDLSLIGIASALIRWRRTLISFALAGVAVGLSLGLLSSRKYLSNATFIPQIANEQSAPAGLALAASQFGIRVAAGGGGWPAATYVELINSRGLLEPIARDTLFVVEEGNQRIAVMDLLEVEADTPARRVEMTIRALRKLIAASEVKKLGAVQLVVTSRWPTVSLALSERLLIGVDRFNAVTRQSQATAERKFTAGQAQDALRALRDAEDRMQSFLQRNRVAFAPDLVFERDRLQREISLRQQTYTSLLQSYEEARIREVRDTPVITILEKPTLAAIGESRQTLLKSAMGGVVGILAALFVIVITVARRSASPGTRQFFQTLEAAMPRFLRRRIQS